MEQRQVLSLDSVDRIRFYVKRKYEHLPKEQHAEIVADAIVKIIDRQLPPFQASLRERICHQLIQEIVVAEKRPVSIEDILQASAKQTTHDAESQMLLAQWIADNGLTEVNHDFSVDAAPSIVEGRTSLKEYISNNVGRHVKALSYSIGFLLVLAIIFLWQQQLTVIQPSAVATELNSNMNMKDSLMEELPSNELPAMYQYIEVDRERLKSYLNTRSSKLVEQPYFDAIIDTAKDFNISPVLLFAITGQEQGFVNRDHKEAEEIANNPFNVFHSWKDYNTTIDDSTAIAARTIVNLSKDRPSDVEAIKWINRKYAEDPNWHIGVTSLYETIMNYINN